MIRLDGFSKVSNVSADNQEVLPDLPVFVVTLQSLLQRTESFASVGGEGQNSHKGVIGISHNYNSFFGLNKLVSLI